MVSQVSAENQEETDKEQEKTNEDGEVGFSSTTQADFNFAENFMFCANGFQTKRETSLDEEATNIEST